MRISMKIAFLIASLMVVALIWIYTPVQNPPEEIWTLELKLRLSGFSLLGLLFFYIFFDRVVFARKNRKKAHPFPPEKTDNVS